MKRGYLLAVAAFAATTALPARAAAVTDCPLATAPFSASSPLIDILLSPAATAIVERETGAKLDAIPKQFLDTKAPTFAAILTLQQGGRFLRADASAIARADAALRRLPVSSADRAARCARYDDDRPSIEVPPGRPRILLFEKITGFKDVPSFDAAHAMFRDLAKREGWGLVASDKGGVMNAATLRQFDVVIWNNISGDVLTIGQRRAFRRYMENGGAFIGVHGTGGDPVYFWDWFADTLIGARFSGHPTGKQFQEARVAIENPANPLARGLPVEWRMTDEWYSFKTNPRSSGATVLATLDESTYEPDGMLGQNLRMGDHPIAWSKCIGKGRMFYSAIGHRPEAYMREEVRTMLTNAVRWTAQVGDCARKP